MMAAMTAAERGMDVELWEKSDRLGGLLLAAGAPEFKKDVMDNGLNTVYPLVHTSL